MNILLYTPPVPKQSIRMDYLISCEPLELEYLYTVLEENHSVFFLEKGGEQSLFKMIAANQIAMLCISCYITHTPYVLLLVQKLKRKFPELYIAVGGVSAEVVPEHFFSPFIDVVVFGNQLSVIRTIADSISGKRMPDLVEGAAFRSNGFKMQPVVSDNRNVSAPKRILFDKYPERYHYLYFKACASLKTASGCPGKCSFCYCRKMNGGFYSARPIAEVVDEIEGMSAENIFIVDDTFLTGAKRLETFCDELEKRKIRKKFIAYGTAHFISGHPELIARLKNNGLSALIVGFEYITNSGLQAVNKGATIGDNDDTIAICRQLNIELFALFICDTDWHHRDFWQLASYLRKNKIRFATFSTPTIFPKTDDAIQQNTVFDIKLLWRYDLLRLHCTPKYISAFSYYLWLFFLYLVPAMSFSSLRHLLSRYGFWRGMGTIVQSSWFGAVYFIKLIIWK
ncbi:MAG: radical SAM protein [Prolixibacteraceae bacterium]|nr:radical SAM protein [Prolixibacteraceae bacterium]